MALIKSVFATGGILIVCMTWKEPETYQGEYILQITIIVT